MAGSLRIPDVSPLHRRRFIETSLLGLPPRWGFHRRFQLRPSLAKGTMFLRNIEGGAEHLIATQAIHPPAAICFSGSLRVPPCLPLHLRCHGMGAQRT